MDPLQRSRGLTKAPGLSSLSDLQKQVGLDARRTGANIALNKSMAAWMCHKSHGGGLGAPREEAHPAELGDSQGRRRALSTLMGPRQSHVSGVRLNLDEDLITTLEVAYKAHVAAFDLDGDNRICTEELIMILDRCRLFDEFFTPGKVRNHFNTWADGCNLSCLTEPWGDDGIGFQEFKFVLQWAADVKCVDVEHCVQKVVRFSRKLCDKEASVQRRLEVVFDSCCKQDRAHMSATEFGNLCRKIHVPFCMGDVFLIFGRQAGGLKEGVDFQGFIGVLTEVGQKLGVGEEVFPTFARAVEFLDTDENTVARIKMRLRQAAGIVAGNDWRQFFHDCDSDGSGTLDWEEFLAICRGRLHLADRESHLRILFERLDLEASGEISIVSMIDFITP